MSASVLSRERDLDTLAAESEPLWWSVRFGQFVGDYGSARLDCPDPVHPRRWFTYEQRRGSMAIRPPVEVYSSEDATKYRRPLSDGLPRGGTGPCHGRTVHIDSALAGGLGDTAIRGLFRAGLRLHSFGAASGEPLGADLAAAVDDIDTVIHEVQRAIFVLTTTPPTAPAGSAAPASRHSDASAEL
jgi:hypothetical protein